MDLCVLPQTGASEQWLVLAVVAFVVIGAGVALALSGKARRRVATGLGALAIVGALAIGGVHAAPAAQADAGASDCITPGAAPAGDVVVTPGIPTLAQQCNVESSVVEPSTTGVTYTQTREGNTATVVAAANPGYQILAGATTTWTYDLTAPTPAPSPVALPGEVRADASGSNPDETATYFTPVDPAFVPSLQTASDAGQLGYSFDATQAAYRVSIDTDDAEGNANPTISAATALPGSVLGYDFALGVYTYSLPADLDQEALFDQLNDQLLQAALDAGIDLETSQLTSGREAIDGLAIAATWDGGAVCGPQVGFVGVDAVIDEFVAPAPGDGAPGFAGDALPMLDAFGTATATDAAPAEAPAVESPAAEPTVEEPTVEEPAAEEAEVVDTPAPEVEVVEPVEG